MSKSKFSEIVGKIIRIYSIVVIVLIIIGSALNYSKSLEKTVRKNYYYKKEVREMMQAAAIANLLETVPIYVISLGIGEILISIPTTLNQLKEEEDTK